MKKSNDHFLKMLEIGNALTTEKNPNKLLEMILTESRKITNCDAGTLYIKEDDVLRFKIIENETLDIFQGSNGEVIDLPSVDINSNSVSAYVARTKEIINIKDVYKEKSELLEGAKKYDKITKYHTQSMLVLPLKDYEGNLIGVMQLINAKNNNNEIVPFLKYHEKMITYHGSQVAMFMSNMKYLDDIHGLFNSFVSMMVTAIDRKAKYNANHTKNIVKLLKGFVEYINNSKNTYLAKHYFDDKKKKEIEMAAWLHDIGKIDIPLSIMDKPTRLAHRLESVLYKLELEIKEIEIQKLKESIDKEEADSRINFLDESLELVKQCNNPSNFITDEDLEKLSHLYEYKPLKDKESLLTEDEYEKITTRKGSLTDKEREIMASHVILTREMLDEIPFTEDLSHVKEWASMHHEHLNGTGYPLGLKGDEIPFEARILTIIDIFEALTSRDRPYKEPMPVERAFKILGFMVKEGKLDEILVDEFEKFVMSNS